MEWALEFVSTVDKENAKFIRETMDAKAKADTGQYGDAARILWELLIQVRHLGNQQWECMTMVHMGKVYRALRWTIAVNLLEDAIELAGRINFDLAKMIALAELGDLRCQWGQFKESLELLSKALTLNEEDQLEYRRQILLNMVVAYEGLDDIARCLELLREVIEIDKQIQSEEIQEDLDYLDRIKKIIDS